MSAELPPLPEPYFIHPFGRELYDAEQMHAYALAARTAALEEAARALNRTGNDHCAAAIRALAG